MAILSVFFPIFDHSALKKTFKDKYASRLPESICCPNSVRPVLFRCDYASLSVRPSMFLSVRKRCKHSAGNIRKRQTSFLTLVTISVLSGVFQQLSGHFPASHMGETCRWTDRKTKERNFSQIQRWIHSLLMHCWVVYFHHHLPCWQDHSLSRLRRDTLNKLKLHTRQAKRIQF